MRLTRNAEAPLLLEQFLLAAVASFLGIRAFLALTGYPRIGSNGIHIAHLLWGGLPLLVALVFLLAFLDRSVQRVAAVIAGLGFGTFIDEIGKFVTADNNYFYRPAIALIYVVFVVGLLLVRALLAAQRPLSEREAIANALGLLAGQQLPLQREDRARILRLLAQADPGEALTRLARDYVAQLPTVSDRHSTLSAIYEKLANGYERLMSNPRAEPVVTGGVIAYTVVVVAVALIAVSSRVGGGGPPLTATIVAQLSPPIAGAACIGMGVIRLRSSRVAAYHWFLRGLLVWIFITQVFVFYSSQLGGVGGLTINLIAYAAVRFALHREIVAGPQRPARASPAA